MSDQRAPVVGPVTLPSKPGALAVHGAVSGDSRATYQWPDADGDQRSTGDAVATLDEAGVDEETYHGAARVCARWYDYALPNFQFVCDREVLWAGTDVLRTPQTGHRSLRVARAVPLAPEQYHLRAGTVRVDQE